MPNKILKLEDELYLDHSNYKYIEIGYKIYELVPFDKVHEYWDEGTILSIYSNNPYYRKYIRVVITKRKVFDNINDALKYLEKKNKIKYLIPTINNMDDAIEYYNNQFKNKKVILIEV